MKLFVALLLLALVLFGVWRWAVAAGAAGLLDWIDARFSREQSIELAAAGSYGPHPAQKVELWRPEGQAFAEPAPPPGADAAPIRHPLVVFIHGGGWYSGAPDDYRFVARTLGEQGYATALVGYRLVPDGRFPAMLEDSVAGLRWIVQNAPAQGIDTGQIVVIGHSAGAYNALMLGLDPRWLRGAGLPGDTIDGVVSLAGPADFYPFDKDSSRNAFGHTESPRATQPVTFAGSGAPPVLLLHGDADTVVRPRNSRALHQALQQAGGRSALVEYPGMSHAGIIMALSKPFAQDGKVLGRITQFLRARGGEASLAQRPASAAVQGEKP